LKQYYCSKKKTIILRKKIETIILRKKIETIILRKKNNSIVLSQKLYKDNLVVIYIV